MTWGKAAAHRMTAFSIAEASTIPAIAQITPCGDHSAGGAIPSGHLGAGLLGSTVVRR